MSFIKKLLRIPAGEATVEAIETYEVRWTSRYGQYSTDVRPEMEIFPSKEGAQAFARAVENAFRIIKYTGLGTDVVMRKRD
jgi:hypothetical protein